jgi:hypothetical protein
MPNLAHDVSSECHLFCILLLWRLLSDVTTVDDVAIAKPPSSNYVVVLDNATILLKVLFHHEASLSHPSAMKSCVFKAPRFPCFIQRNTILLYLDGVHMLYFLRSSYTVYIGACMYVCIYPVFNFRSC